MPSHQPTSSIQSSRTARRRAGPALLFVAAASTGVPLAASAHGFVGQRFFPATIATDDPFVADELSLPTLSSVRNNAGDDGPASRQTSAAIDFSKRLTPNLGLSFGAAHRRFSFGGPAAVSGWDNVELGLKYQLYRNDGSESLLSAGLGWDIGGTGRDDVGADRFSTFTPTLYFGQGLGALPPGVQYLRPLAVTGTLGVAVPGQAATSERSVDPDTGLPVVQDRRHPHVLQVGLAFEYSVPYLQSAVKDLGLGAPWNRMVAVVEIAAERPLDRIDNRQWTGTIDPGVLWAGRSIQLGVEAIVPINRASGHGVGVQVQLHFFLDDLLPKTMGRPLLGRGG
jgi:hypothetical protein